MNEIDWENVDIILIEEYSCDNKDQLERRERYWIDTLNPTLNKAIPTRTNKEWYEQNKDVINEKKREYREQNPDKTKEYYQKNKEDIREKGMQYRKQNKEKIKEHYEQNKDKINARRRERAALKRQAQQNN